MPIDETLSKVGELFSKLKTHTPFSGDRQLHDFRPDPPTFDVSTDYIVLEKGAEVQAVKPNAELAPILFEAFIDGVQRSTVLTRVPVAGYPVPIHIAQIATAVVARGENRKLYAPQDFIYSRLLILAPFSIMKESGWDDADIFLENAQKLGFARDNDNETIYRVPSPETSVVICDTTHTGVGKDQEAKEKSSFTEETMADTGHIANRALGRVKWLRTILEMLTLYNFRQSHGHENWVAVDGPLIFLRTQAMRMKEVLGKKEFDPLHTLKNAVGIVKEVRLRLKKQELKTVYDLDEDECSSLVALGQCVDLKGTDEEATNDYDKKHLTLFTRLRRPKYGLKLPTSEGLVGVDTYLSTYGFATSDEVTYENMLNYGRVELAHRIVNGVWRERWPGIKDRNRALTEIFPVEQTERFLQSRLFSLREMAYLASRLKLI